MKKRLTLSRDERLDSIRVWAFPKKTLSRPRAVPPSLRGGPSLVKSVQNKIFMRSKVSTFIMNDSDVASPTNVIQISCSLTWFYRRLLDFSLFFFLFMIYLLFKRRDAWGDKRRRWRKTCFWFKFSGTSGKERTINHNAPFFSSEVDRQFDACTFSLL